MPQYSRWPFPAGGSGGGDGFKTIDVPTGIDPVATGPEDILTLTNSDGLIGIDGIGSNTIDFTIDGIIPIDHGGTGEATAIDAFNALSPLTTVGDLIGFDGTDNVRVPVGTDGYILVADSAEPAGIKWEAIGPATNSFGIIDVPVGTNPEATTPTDTLTLTAVDGIIGITGDAGTDTIDFSIAGIIPIANGGTGEASKTPAFDALSPTSSKGDLIVHDGTDNIRLGVGSDGQYLQANSAQTSGLEWVTVTPANAFGTIAVPAGTNPVADSPSDTLNLTSSDNILTITGTAASDTVDFTVGSGFNEFAQDAVGTILVDSSTVDFTYNDGVPSITAAVIPGGVDHNSLANLTTGDPHTQYFLLAGRSPAQTAYGGTGSAQDLTLKSTSNATKGRVVIQESVSLSLDPWGTGAGETTHLRLKELAANGTNYTGFKAPDLLSADLMYTMPSAAPLVGQVLMSDASNVLSWTYDNSGWFGQGGDGDITYSVDTNLAGPVYYNNITINSGVNVSTAGYAIFCRGTLTNNGTIRHNGVNGTTGGAGGNGATGANYGGGGAGGAGSANNGVASSAQANSIGSIGGNGGAGGTGSGGTAGAANTPALSAGGAKLINNMTSLMNGAILTASTRWNGGNGGAGGGGDTTNIGGGGGGGGGTLVVFARVVAGNGVFQAKGGNGGNGAATGNTGGGGGGGGGVAVVVSTTGIGSCTFDVAAGTGGSPNGTGVAGSNGTAGTSLSFILQRAT